MQVTHHPLVAPVLECPAVRGVVERLLPADSSRPHEPVRCLDTKWCVPDAFPRVRRALRPWPQRENGVGKHCTRWLGVHVCVCVPQDARGRARGIHVPALRRGVLRGPRLRRELDPAGRRTPDCRRVFHPPQLVIASLVNTAASHAHPAVGARNAGRRSCWWQQLSLAWNLHPFPTLL